MEDDVKRSMVMLKLLADGLDLDGKGVQMDGKISRHIGMPSILGRARIIEVPLVTCPQEQPVKDQSARCTAEARGVSSSARWR